MSKPILIALGAVLAISFSAIAAHAADNKINVAAAKTAERVEIIQDEDSGVIRFVIDGQEVVRIDQNGLQVRESIEYGGTLTDSGIARFDAQQSGEPVQ